LNPVANIKGGDEFVFQQVFEEYHEKLYYYTLGKTKSAYLAEEVTQITFVKLWQNRERLDEALTISIQLFRIAKTTLIDLLRKQASLTALVNGLRGEGEANATDANSIIDHNEASRKLLEVINHLPPVRKRVFEMSRFQGMPHKEIARELSISTKTVEKHISKAITQLRPYFKGMFSLGMLLIILQNR
jgi:RNA polymerase sigma-70 factor (family 1)